MTTLTHARIRLLGAKYASVGLLAAVGFAGFLWDRSPAAAQSVGSAASYAILGGSAVNANGTGSVITGDVGVSPGTSITGFPANATIVPPFTTHANDGSAIAAQTSVTALYTSLVGAGPCSPLLMQLDGVTVGPGIYCFTSTADLASTGTLTLDGAGIYIFQVGSSLTANVLSSVVLINGADACDVFWQVTSAATIDGVTFAGNVVAQAGVTLGVGANLTGRALTTAAGAVTLAGTNTVGGCSLQETPTASFTATASATPTVTASATSTATSTPLQTATSTPTETPTATAIATSTATATETASATPTGIASATASPTATSVATSTSSPTATATFVDTATATPTDTPSPTSTLAPGTATETPTQTAVATQTATGTLTPTNTPTDSPSATPSMTATADATSSATPSNTPTETATAVQTASNTPTDTQTLTPTNTPTTTPSNTTTATFTVTRTRPPIPVVTSPVGPAGLILIGGLSIALLWALRRLGT